MSLGEFLRSEREKRGISVEQVASATKINVKILQALESDHYAQLPAKPFVRGFASTYARFIGLDSKEVLAQFASEIDVHAKGQDSGPSESSGFLLETRTADRSRAFLWVIMVSFIVIGGIAMMILNPGVRHRKNAHLNKLQKPVATKTDEAELTAEVEKPEIIEGKTDAVAEAKKDAPPPPPAVVQPPPVVVPPKPVEVAAPTPAPVPALKSLEPGFTPKESDSLHKGDVLAADKIFFKLVFKTTEDVWIRYRVDDRPMISFRLQKDSSIVFRAEKGIIFQIKETNSVVYRLDKTREYKQLENYPHFEKIHDAQILGGHPLQYFENTKKNLASFPPLPGA